MAGKRNCNRTKRNIGNKNKLFTQEKVHLLNNTSRSLRSKEYERN